MTNGNVPLGAHSVYSKSIQRVRILNETTTRNGVYRELNVTATTLFSDPKRGHSAVLFFGSPTTDTKNYARSIDYGHVGTRETTKNTRVKKNKYAK